MHDTKEAGGRLKADHLHGKRNREAHPPGGYLNSTS